MQRQRHPRGNQAPASGAHPRADRQGFTLNAPTVDGVLVIDKPDGLTSHDVVAVARRALGQGRIGHTGTLDPFATGVLPLACGKATRLVRFMAASDKTYAARVRFGLVTDTYDITGAEVSRSDLRPPLDAVLAAIDGMRGEQMQTPPPFSAKHVDGRRAYELARKQMPVSLQPVRVRLEAVEIGRFADDVIDLTLTCSSGFYVRSFAHDLGRHLGVGACLEALKRTRSGQFTNDQALTLADLDSGKGRQAIMPLSVLLPHLPCVQTTPAGRERLRHGQLIRPMDLSTAVPPGRHPDRHPIGQEPEWIRVLDERGSLIGVCTRWDADGTLRPNIVLI